MFSTFSSLTEQSIDNRLLVKSSLAAPLTTMLFDKARK